jgi:hypothetical protein
MGEDPLNDGRVFNRGGAVSTRQNPEMSWQRTTFHLPGRAVLRAAVWAKRDFSVAFTGFSAVSAVAQVLLITSSMRQHPLALAALDDIPNVGRLALSDGV